MDQMAARLHEMADRVEEVGRRDRERVAGDLDARITQLEAAVALLARQLLLAIEHQGRWPAQEDRVALARLGTDHPSAWGR